MEVPVDNTKWLSFSLSSMEMLNSSSQSQSHHHPPPDSHHFYSFADDNFYANNGWANPKPEVMYDVESESCHDEVNNKESVFTNFFAGGNSAETHDSSTLTHHMYDGYLSNGDDFIKTTSYNNTGFQPFSANSGSEVDDSAFADESGTELMITAYSHHHCPITTAATNNALSLGVVNNNNSSNSNVVVMSNVDQSAAPATNVESDHCKKIAADTNFGHRTSIYRGVTRHRWTGRYEAHLWDNSCRREGQARKGRQGGYDKEDKAARAYDLAALKYWGPTATTNFPISNYTKELEEMKHATKQEFIASLRRKSSGFSRGASIYRGVTRHHQQGRWQARIGRVAGNKDLYLGTFATEEEAAEAYDIAAIKFRGVNAVTNFEMSRYDVEAIAKSPLPVGGTTKRLKLNIESKEKLPSGTPSSSISFSAIPPASTIPCGVPFDAAPPFYHHHNFFHHFSNLGPSDASGPVSSMVTPVTLMPSPSELFIWPNESY
ncbi:hypothetical protein BUALT_Bualt11G0025300 [Buddleja alternifolia]|uniref:AP2/ERF domain-containing protein n=1 Tax=Buddleja alternifolia TaxID=168488 RepID=A0AAV6X2T9_9LAMI|nr:hypothetical protein BUALT_Bualt11G0025300 [Buddleja alternifolia]